MTFLQTHLKSSGKRSNTFPSPLSRPVVPKLRPEHFVAPARVPRFDNRAFVRPEVFVQGHQGCCPYHLPVCSVYASNNNVSCDGDSLKGRLPKETSVDRQAYGNRASNWCRQNHNMTSITRKTRFGAACMSTSSSASLAQCFGERDVEHTSTEGDCVGSSGMPSTSTILNKTAQNTH
jgi:hypothetical protein